MISGEWWIVFIVMFLLCFFVYAMVRNFFTLVFINNPQAKIMAKVNPLESVPPLLLIGTVLVVGVMRPEFVIDLINKAILVLPH